MEPRDTDPEHDPVSERLIEAWGPVLDHLDARTKEQVQQAIEPLVAQIVGLEVMVTEQATRLADLEAQVARLTDESKP
jgi:hypothetical protein